MSFEIFISKAKTTYNTNLWTPKMEFLPLNLNFDPKKEHLVIGLMSVSTSKTAYFSPKNDKKWQKNGVSLGRDHDLRDDFFPDQTF